MSKRHHSYKWELVRARVMRMHKGLCANPFGLHTNKGMVSELGNYTAATVVHHIIPISYAPELAYRISNLVPLCNDCHELAHTLFECDKPEYRRCFGLDDSITLCKSTDFTGTQTQELEEKREERQSFFTGERCHPLASGGGWFCARQGRNRAEPCASCALRVGGRKV